MSLDHPIIPDRRNWKASLALLILRIPISLIFLNAGSMKIFKMGVSSFVDMASKQVPSYLPNAVGRGYLYLLPFVELLVGALLLLGLFTRTTAVIATLVLISIVMAATGWRGENGGWIHSNLVLLSVAIALALLGPGRWSLDAVFFGRRRG